MAVDTENKRRSVSGYTGSVILPAADARISAADRAHVARIYRGLFRNIGVLSFELESMLLSSMETEQIALSTFSSEAMALATLSDGQMALSEFSDEQMALSILDDENLEN